MKTSINTESINSTDKKNDYRVVWLFPSLLRGRYWHPVFSSFTQKKPNTVIYTGIWSGFAKGYEGSFNVKVIGSTRSFLTKNVKDGYKGGFLFPSLGILPILFKSRPQVIITNAFSLWTIFSIVIKFLFGSKIIVLFDGISPGKNSLNSGIRIYLRRFMKNFIDAFIANSEAGKDYLNRIVKVQEHKIYVHTYLIPDLEALGASSQKELENNEICIGPAPGKNVFLYVGQLVPRKGIHYLLQACSSLKEQGNDTFYLLIVGDGEERTSIEEYLRDHRLENNVKLLGNIDYHLLSQYFTASDIFVFPSLEDVWGVVVAEAMAFGKPVLCSQWAGASELIKEGENGFIFNPHDFDHLARLMKRMVEDKSLVKKMGNNSLQTAKSFSTEATVRFLFDVMEKIRES